MRYLIFVISLIIVSFINPAYSGWFGPDNYQDCVLEKMKGQDKRMLGTARNACEISFPFETLLDKYDKEEIKHAWTIANNYKLGIEITENYSKYEVTKIKAQFSKKSCENAEDTDYILKKTFVFSGDTEASTDVKNGDTYKCMSVIDIYGMRKN